MPVESPGAVRGAAPSVATVRRRAILMVLVSSGSFAVVSAMVKLAAPEIPVAELMLFRSGVAMLVMLPMIVRAGGWSVLRPRRPLSHLARAASGLAGMFGSFYGFSRLPIASVTALGFAMPIFLALLSVPLLGERVGWGRAVSIAAGLLGVALVVQPWRAAGGLPLFDTGVVLVGVLAWALSMISIRRLGQAGERNLTIVAVFSLFCLVFSAVLTIPVWVTPRPAMLGLLVTIGLISGAAQLVMTEAYRSGEASMLAPFEYSAIFYAVALGWGVWGEVPGVWAALGMAVLVVSGLYAWWREGRD